MISAYISGINDCQSESAHCSFGFKNLNECLITSDLWGTMWFLSLLWNTAKALHPHEDIWGSVRVHNHSVISGLTNLLLGVFRSVWYIPCTAVVRAQLASCSFSELLSVCSYCLFFVGSFSGQNFSSVHRRCSSLTLLSGNFHLTLGRGQMWSGREKREHLHIWGCGSWLLL